MSIVTNFLNLFKYDDTDKANRVKFNIETALNENWDKIDTAIEQDRVNWEKKADIKKTITRQNWQTITGTLADFIKSQITNGNVYGSVWCVGGTDMNGLAGYVTWESDSGASGTVFVKFDVVSTNNRKKQYRTFALSTATWIESDWLTIATTDKIDILLTASIGYTIVVQHCYRINNVVYIRARIKITSGVLPAILC